MKKTLTFLGMIFILSTILALSCASAQYSTDAVLTGVCGEGSEVYWEILPNDEGKYTMNIFGEGAFKNLTPEGNNVGYSNPDACAWNEYRLDITKVIIGDGITAFSYGSFMHHKALHTIELGASISSLDTAAMEGCDALKTIYRRGNEPEIGTFDLRGITYFGGYLFDGCRYVDNIILPEDGSYALNAEFLKGNTSLKSIHIPAACTHLSEIAFRNCTALEAVYFEGDADVREGEITKGSEGTFFAYAFHNCGVKGSDGVYRFSISAKEGTPAYDYAMRNAEHSITVVETAIDEETNETIIVSSTTTNYEIGYIDAYDVTIVEDDAVILNAQVVHGFKINHTYVDGDKSYILFADEGCTSLISDIDITSDVTVYAKKLFDFRGYMVRVADYHGLRAIYDYDTSVFKNLNNCTVLEVGVLGGDKFGISTSITLDSKDISKIVICNGDEIVGKLTEYPRNNTITFSSTAVGYEEDGELVPSRIANTILSRAYVTIRDDITGDIITCYSVQSEKDLTSACEATIEAGGSSLGQDAHDFLSDLVDLGIDVDYIYSKEEAMEHLTAIYDDPEHLLSGQHISVGKYTVRNSLDKLYKATGKFPAVLSYDVSNAYRDAGYGDTYTTLVADDFAEYAKQGGLISMCAHMTNPDPDIDPSTIDGGPYRGTLNTIDKWDQLLLKNGNTSDNAIHTNFMTELSAIADFLQKLEDRGVTVFWRPYHETNGAFFWFCGASIPKKNGVDVSAEYFKDLWIMTYNYLVTERGLSNLIWMYSPNCAKDGSTSSAYDVMKYYPGDEYVEVTGLDIYHDSDTLAGVKPALVQDAYSENWSRLANKYTGNTLYDPVGKDMPVVYGEFGPGTALRDKDPLLSYNGEDALDFVKKVEASGRRMGWIVFWNGWSDNWISLDLMYKGDVFMKDDYILDLGESREIILDNHYSK